MERFLVYRAKPGKNHNAHGIAFAAQPQAIFFIRTQYEESRQKSRGANAILALNEYPNIKAILSIIMPTMAIMVPSPVFMPIACVNTKHMAST